MCVRRSLPRPTATPAEMEAPMDGNRDEAAHRRPPEVWEGSPIWRAVSIIRCYVRKHPKPGALSMGAWGPELLPYPHAAPGAAPPRRSQQGRFPSSLEICTKREAPKQSRCTEQVLHWPPRAVAGRKPASPLLGPRTLWTDGHRQMWPCSPHPRPSRSCRGPACRRPRQVPSREDFSEVERGASSFPQIVFS